MSDKSLTQVSALIAKTFTSEFAAKMAAAKVTKRLGFKYVHVGPSAVDGTYSIELDVPAAAAKKSVVTKLIPQGVFHVLEKWGKKYVKVVGRQNAEVWLKIDAVGCAGTWVSESEIEVAASQRLITRRPDVFGQPKAA